MEEVDCSEGGGHLVIDVVVSGKVSPNVRVIACASGGLEGMEGEQSGMLLESGRSEWFKKVAGWIGVHGIRS